MLKIKTFSLLALSHFFMVHAIAAGADEKLWVHQIKDLNIQEESKMDYTGLNGDCFAVMPDVCRYVLSSFCRRIRLSTNRCVVQLMYREDSVARKNRDEISLRYLDAVGYETNVLGSSLMTATDNCRSESHLGKSIYAVGSFRWHRKDYGTSRNVLVAWMVDVTGKRFVEIDPKSVKCVIKEDRN